MKGRVSEEDERASKLICESIVPFQEMKKELWIQYPRTKQNIYKEEQNLYQMLKSSEGPDSVVIYCKEEKAIKRLPMNRNVGIDQIFCRLTNYYGEKRVKVVEKSIEKTI